jgi:hypothetical protein
MTPRRNSDLGTMYSGAFKPFVERHCRGDIAAKTCIDL